MISTPFGLLQLALVLLMLVFFALAVEYRRLVFGVVSFAVANGLLSLLFFILGAPYVAVFNFSVFSGAVAILFLAVINMERPEEAVPGDGGSEVTT